MTTTIAPLPRLRFADNTPDAPSTDVDYCLQLDKFDFVLTVRREDGLPVARKGG